MRLTWTKFGEALSLLGVFYFVGFLMVVAISLFVLLPRYQELYQTSDQDAIFSRALEMVGTLTPVFLLISSAAWYQGRRLTKEGKIDGFDQYVGVALFGALILILTPQLYIAITSLIPVVLP